MNWKGESSTVTFQQVHSMAFTKNFHPLNSQNRQGMTRPLVQLVAAPARESIGDVHHLGGLLQVASRIWNGSQADGLTLA